MLHGTATLSLAIGHLPIYILVFTVVFLVPHVAHHSCALPGSSAGAWEPVFLCLYLLRSVCLRPCLCVSVSMCLCLSEACAGSSAGAWESVFQSLYLLGFVSVCVSASVSVSVCVFVFVGGVCRF